MNHPGLSVRVWNGTRIRRRDQDGYVSATAMCQANGKRLNDYTRCERTEAYIAALAADAGIPATGIIDVRRGGTPSTQGTWIHPRLAVDLARWISPQFAVWMDGWFLAAMQATYQPAGEPAGPNGRVDLALTLLHEAIATIDPTRSFRPCDAQIWVERLGPSVRSTPLRNPAAIDLPFKVSRRVRAAAV